MISRNFCGKNSEIKFPQFPHCVTDSTIHYFQNHDTHHHNWSPPCYGQMLHFVHIAAFDRKMDPAQLINFVISCGKKEFFLLTPCVIFVFFWHFRFSSICYAWWQSNNDIRVIILPYICWCPKGVILTIIVKCWTKWSLTSQSWTLDQSFRLSFHF